MQVIPLNVQSLSFRFTHLLQFETSLFQSGIMNLGFRGWNWGRRIG